MIPEHKVGGTDCGPKTRSISQTKRAMVETPRRKLSGTFTRILYHSIYSPLSEVLIVAQMMALKSFGEAQTSSRQCQVATRLGNVQKHALMLDRSTIGRGIASERCCSVAGIELWAAADPSYTEELQENRASTCALSSQNPAPHASQKPGQLSMSTQMQRLAAEVRTKSTTS